MLGYKLYVVFFFQNISMYSYYIYMIYIIFKFFQYMFNVFIYFIQIKGYVQIRRVEVFKRNGSRRGNCFRALS